MVEAREWDMEQIIKLGVQEQFIGQHLTGMAE